MILSAHWRWPKWTILALLALVSFEARAHDPGLSALNLRITPDRIEAELVLARPDFESLVWMDSNLDGRIGAAEFEAARDKIDAVAFDALEVRLDDKPINAARVTRLLDPNDAIRLTVEFEGKPAGTLHLRSAILDQLPKGHRQYASIRDDRDDLLLEKMLDARDQSIDLPLHARMTSDASSGGSPGWHEFLKLGVEHILTGTDHLVFLFGLLIVGAQFRTAVKIISAFTVAHSITLALATLDWIRLSGRIVEPLIAVSIIYVGLENMISRNLDRRWMLAFGFGLIHGCGFASVLRNAGIGLGAANVAIPLLTFNLGVELGQLAIAALILPIIWQLKDRPFYAPRFVPACSLLVTAAGAFWLIQRLVR
jgi:hydrogenase/urease accessory protein HupE